MGAAAEVLIKRELTCTAPLPVGQAVRADLSRSMINHHDWYDTDGPDPSACAVITMIAASVGVGDRD